MKKSIILLLIFTIIFTLSSCTSNVHSVNFYTNGGSDIESVEIKDKGNVLEPSAPIKEGYTFLGWFSDSTFNNIYDFSNPVTSTLNLFAKWSINQYTISFDSNGGSALAAITQDFNTPINEPTNPVKDGYDFEGW